MASMKNEMSQNVVRFEIWNVEISYSYMKPSLEIQKCNFQKKLSPEIYWLEIPDLFVKDLLNFKEDILFFCVIFTNMNDFPEIFRLQCSTK